MMEIVGMYSFWAEIHLCVKWGRMFERALLSSQSLVNILFCENFCVHIQICNWIFWLMNALLMCPCLYTALTFLLPKIYVCIYIYIIYVYIYAIYPISVRYMICMYKIYHSVTQIICLLPVYLGTDIF